MYSIGKTFSFAAAHHLPQLPAEHKCHRPHGHNYLVTYELASADLDPTGFVVDYAALTDHWQDVSALLDHNDLNVVFDGVLQPTAENLARWLYDDAKEKLGWLVAVRVQETPSTFAEYRP